MIKAASLSMKVDLGKSIASMIPAAIAAPVFASDVKYVHITLLLIFFNLALLIFEGPHNHYARLP